MNFNFITEMEDAQDILKSIYNQPGISAQMKKLIEALFIFIQDRQCVSSAALQAEDAYVALREEREELEERDQAIFEALNAIMASSSMGQRMEIMELYNQLMRACKEFQKLFAKVVKYKGRVSTELEILNKKLENFNDKIKELGNFGSENVTTSFKVPKLQVKKVTKCTEAAFDRIDVANKFIQRLRGKLDVVEDILKHPEKLMHLQQEDPESSSSSSSSPSASGGEDESDVCEALLNEMDICD